MGSFDNYIEPAQSDDLESRRNKWFNKWATNARIRCCETQIAILEGTIKAIIYYSNRSDIITRLKECISLLKQEIRYSLEHDACEYPGPCPKE